MRTPDSWHTAQATVAIAVVTTIIEVIVGTFDLRDWAVALGAFVPADLSRDFAFARVPFFLTPLTSALLHAGFLHLAFNLLILLFCGRAVEGAIGPVNLVIIYAVGAYAAAAGHFALGPESLQPMVGASGATSAVLGAYAMLFGKNRVRVANPRLALWLNVLWLLAAWIVLQVIWTIAMQTNGIQVAVGAHIGGFIAGVALARPLLLWRYRNA